MSSKIRIKMGPMEIEYEGSEDFLKTELPSLITVVSTLYKQSGLASTGGGTNITESHKGQAGGSKLQMTTASIAANLQSKSGSDLVLAACAKLDFGLGNASYTRDQINSEMKSASGYYKTSYTSNLSNYLQTLVKEGELNEQATDTYALTPDARTKMAQRLGLAH